MTGVDNKIICINQNAKDAGQIALMTDRIVDLHFNGDTQCFPRWLPGEKSSFGDGMLNLGEKEGVPSGFSSEALPHFQAAYPGKSISEDDLFYYIYGILHSEDYRTRYANNLMKELPAFLASQPMSSSWLSPKLVVSWPSSTYASKK